MEEWERLLSKKKPAEVKRGSDYINDITRNDNYRISE